MTDDLIERLPSRQEVGAAIVAAIRLTPDCDPSEFVACVLESVSLDDGDELDEASLPTLTAPAVLSLNHRLNIAVGYFGADENERHLAYEQACERIECFVAASLANKE